MFAPPSDPNDLAQSGWGIVVPSDLDPAVDDALRPLLDLRSQQAGRLYHRMKCLPRESASSFLARYGVGAGSVNPERMPYYLLLIGAPAQIPFEFQQQLDRRFAVGRLHFDDDSQYARYAASVVAAESGGVPQGRELAIFAPRYGNDPHAATLAGLASDVARDTLRESDWRTSLRTGVDASKAALAELLARPGGPAILLTAAHSVVTRTGEEPAAHGAVLCEDWSGPGAPLSPNVVFSGNDVTDDLANVHGLVAILWGSCTAGAGGFGDFGAAEDGAAFVPALAQRLLSGSRKNAVAVIGLAGRMLGSSLGPGSPSPRPALTLAIRALTQGHRTGHAMQSLDEASVALSIELSDTLEQAKFGREVDPLRLAHLWSTTMDLRHVVLLGDPAAKLPAASSAGTELDTMADALLAYLRSRRFTMASFERLRERVNPRFTDRMFHELIRSRPTIFRHAVIKGGKPGIAKKIP